MLYSFAFFLEFWSIFLVDYIGEMSWHAPAASSTTFRGKKKENDT